jgi:hypothetical protein
MFWAIFVILLVLWGDWIAMPYQVDPKPSAVRTAAVRNS